MPVTELQIVQTDISDLYQGWNTFAGTSKVPAVDGLPSPAGEVKEVRYQRCDDTISLFQALNIDTSISGSYDFLDSGTAKVDFYRSLQTTSYSVTLVVYKRLAAAFRYQDLYWKQPKPTVATLDEFLVQHGDSWVSQIEKGGEFIGAYVFYSESETERQSVTSTLEALGIFEDGGLDISFEEKFRSAFKSIQKRKNYRAYLSGYKTKDLPGPETMVRFALDLGEPENPIPIRFKVEGYEVAGASSEVFENVILNRRLFLGVAGSDGLGPNRAKLRTVQNQVKQIRDIWTAYDYQGDPLFNKRAAQIEMDVSTLDKTVAAIGDQPSKQAAAPVLKSLNYGSPVLEWEWQQHEGWGGNGGDPFYDVPGSALLSARRIAILQGRGGSVVDCLITTYTSDDADTVTTRHGGNGGQESRTLTVGENDRIIRISGTYGSVINSLEFITKRDRIKFPEQPEGTQGKIDLEIADGFALVGFEGRSGSKLDHLTPRVVKFKPASWKIKDHEPSENGVVPGAKESFSPGHVFNRYPLHNVTDQSLFPHCYTGRVRSDLMDGTGVLVGSRHVITAAHNVYDRAQGKKATTVTFWLQLNVSNFPVQYQEIRVKDVSFPEGYTKRPPWFQESFDYALLTLESPVPNPPQPTLRCDVVTPAMIEDFKHQIYISGYSAKDEKQMQYADAPLILGPMKTLPEFLFSQASCDHGTSGAGIIAGDPNHPRSLAILKGYAAAASQDANWAVRLTREVMKDLWSWGLPRP